VAAKTPSQHLPDAKDLYRAPSTRRTVTRMIRVEARNGEPLEKTLRRFKKRCEKEGLTKDIKKNLYYDKPSEKKRREYRKLEKRIEGERLEAARALKQRV
jgi:small subunit ribosomal protein S21